MVLSAITHCNIFGLIGINGQLAYRSSEDFNEFKEQTLGNQTIGGITYVNSADYKLANKPITITL